MGAHEFSTFIETEDPMAQAYDRAVREAQYEYGHDPYNGTISTTSGSIKAAGPVSKEIAIQLMNEYWEFDNSYEELGDDYVRTGTNPFVSGAQVEKWGAALAIEVSEPRGWWFFGLAAS